MTDDANFVANSMLDAFVDASLKTHPDVSREVAIKLMLAEIVTND